MKTLEQLREEANDAWTGMTQCSYTISEADRIWSRKDKSITFELYCDAISKFTEAYKVWVLADADLSSAMEKARTLPEEKQRDEQDRGATTGSGETARTSTKRRLKGGTC